MVAKRYPTHRIERAGAKRYLKKAAEFFESMQQAVADERWNAVGLNAVHCAISACDAVLVYYTEQRSAGSDHETASYLLASLQKVPDVKQKADTLRRIVQEKHLIEYEDRSFTSSEAAELVKLTERFHRWANDLVGS
ncbi:MAG: HEPN domain-containing protein [Candidatus Omnitrophica bacterium]|nr:HEPN domain-containing protein [Candidatus Omnitrophota bacterium]